MTRFFWIAYVATSALLALALQAPAWIVDRGVRAASGERLYLDYAHGTLWNGSGNLFALGSSALIASDVHWTLAPWSLLTARAQGRLWQGGMGDPKSPGEYSFGRDAVALRNLRLRFAVDALPSPLNRLGWQPRGQIEIDAREFVRDAQNATGTVQAQWHDASLTASGGTLVLALGEVRMSCAPQAQATLCSIDNQGGDAQLHGDARFAAAQTLQLNARLRPNAGMSPQVLALLQQAGPADADGSIHLIYNAPALRP
jgi:general secretion pathway protein N